MQEQFSPPARPTEAVSPPSVAIPVSFGYFGHIQDKTGTRNTCTFDEFEQWIAHQINESTCPNFWPDKDKHKDAKGKLPYFTVCTFRGTRLQVTAEDATCLVFDLDSIGETELEALLGNLQCFRGFAYASASDRLKPGRCVRIVLALAGESLPETAFDLALKAIRHQFQIPNDPQTEQIERAFFLGRLEGTAPREFWHLGGKPVPAMLAAERGRQLAEQGLIEIREAPKHKVPDEVIEDVPDAPAESVTRFAEYLLAQSGKSRHEDPTQPKNARFTHCLAGARYGLNVPQIEAAMREHYLPRHHCETSDHVLRKDANNAVGRVIEEKEAKDEIERARAEEFAGRLARGELVGAPASGGTSATVPAWTELGISEICAPLPPVPWLVQDLEIAPGAPAIIGGYGFSGKTVAAQALALSVATGKPVWGAFAARTGRVLHIDYEQGSRLTRDRYQRLMVGIGATAEQVGERLVVVPMPGVYMSSHSTEEFLSRRCEGLDLTIIDSLHASCPGIEENEAGARAPLDMLTRVSERTGCAFVVIHHARKPSKDGAGGAKVGLRGSGALFDACASVLMFAADKDEPPTVKHEKARITGKTAGDFALKIEDTNGNAGLVVRRADSEIETSAQIDRTLAENCEKIRIAFAALAPGEHFQSKEAIRARTRMGKEPFLVAFSTLLGRNELFPEGRGANTRFIMPPLASRTVEQLQRQP
ncbi:MAG: AAA family ATPase [Pseudomonadota bacterium]